MNTLAEIGRAINLFLDYGATSLEAEHDQIYVTVKKPLDPNAESFVRACGFFPEEATEFPTTLWTRFV